MAPARRLFGRRVALGIRQRVRLTPGRQMLHDGLTRWHGTPLAEQTPQVTTPPLAVCLMRGAVCLSIGTVGSHLSDQPISGRRYRLKMILRNRLSRRLLRLQAATQSVRSGHKGEFRFELRVRSVF